MCLVMRIFSIRKLMGRWRILLTGMVESPSKRSRRDASDRAETSHCESYLYGQHESAESRSEGPESPALSGVFPSRGTSGAEATALRSSERQLMSEGTRTRYAAPQGYPRSAQRPQRRRGRWVTPTACDKPRPVPRLGAAHNHNGCAALPAAAAHHDKRPARRPRA